MKKIGSLVDRELDRHAQLLERMTTSLRQRLPQHLAKHCWVGNYAGTCVTLITDDTTFTTPINYHQHEIVKQLNETFAAELGCRFKKARVEVSRLTIPGTENQPQTKRTGTLNSDL